MEDDKERRRSDMRVPLITRREVLVSAGMLVGGLAFAPIIEACGGGTSGGGGSSTPKRGGNFRLGVTGGGAKDMMDGQNIITKPDQARLVTAYETLLSYDESYKLGTDGLAESATQDAPDQWTVRLKQGIEWHNGKTLNADDVIYSFKRMLDKSNGLFGAAGLSTIDAKQISKMDDRTVRFKLTQADSTIGEQLGQYYNGMVPVGYKRYNAADPSTTAQVGTGPYKLKSFTPGQQSVHERNPNYWRSGQPYFDTVTIIDFSDPAAQVNALLGGQVDAITDVPFAQVDAVKAHAGLSVLESPGGGWLPLCMAIDIPPFNNNDVRQAFRYIVDRQAFVNQVLSGHGRIANDLYAPFDACFASDLPQRKQDLDKAKSLLAKANMSGATFDLHTTDGAAGMVDSANIFAQQAKGAGITVNVHNDPNYYGDNYLKLGFSVDFWGTRSYLPQVGNGSIPTAPYNETHWPPKDSNYIALYNQALAETDPNKRCQIVHAMQQLEYDQGGYIIPFFNDLVDGYSTKVSGFQPSKGTLNLDSFGHGYRTIWFG